MVVPSRGTCFVTLDITRIKGIIHGQYLQGFSNRNGDLQLTKANSEERPGADFRVRCQISEKLQLMCPFLSLEDPEICIQGCIAPYRFHVSRSRIQRSFSSGAFGPIAILRHRCISVF